MVDSGPAMSERPRSEASPIAPALPDGVVPWVQAFGRLLALSGGALAVIDPTDAIVVASDELAALTGVAATSLQGSLLTELLLPASGSSPPAARGWPAFNGGVVEVRRPDGSSFPAEVSNQSIGAGSTELRLVTLTPLSGTGPEEILRSRRGQALDRLPLGVWIWEVGPSRSPEEARLVMVNKTAREMAPLTIRECRVGMTLREAGFDDARIEEVRDAFRVAGTAETYDLGTRVSDTPTGRRVLRRHTCSVGPDAVAVVITDVTEDMELARQRQAALDLVERVGADERRRIADGLHDDVIQRLASMLLDVESMRRQPDHDLGEGLAALQGTVRGTIELLRQLIFDLAPPDLLSGGIEGSLGRVGEHLFGATDVAWSLSVDLPGDVDRNVLAVAYRIASEALVNIRKHADASVVEVRIGAEAGSLRVTVTDDGAGVPPDAWDRPGHRGLRGMRERAERLGGTLSIGPAPGGGTVVSASLPLRPAAATLPVPNPAWRPPPTGPKPDPVTPRVIPEGLLAASPDVITCYDSALHYVFVNAAGARSAGVRQTDILGHTNQELGMEPGLADLLAEAIAEPFRTARPHRVRYARNERRGGRQYDTLLVPELSGAPEFAVRRVWGFTRDVTETPGYPPVLLPGVGAGSYSGLGGTMAPEGLLRVLNASTDVIFTFESNQMVFTWVNEMTAGIYDLPAASLAGYGFADLGAPAALVERWGVAHQMAVEACSPVRFLTGPGRWGAVYDALFTPVVDGSGGVSCVWGVLRNKTGLLPPLPL